MKMNPVFMKEIKLRFRNAKSFSALAFYLIALTLLILAYLIVVTDFVGTGYFRPNESFVLFCCLTALQMGLVLFMTPALTAGAVSAEREKQTLSMLLTTTLTSPQIIVGKLLASIAFLVLLLIATLPMYSLVFLFGGVSPSQLLSVFALFLLTVFSIGSVGILFSTVTKKTVVSMISTYGMAIFLTLFTAIFFFVGIATMQGETAHPLSYLWIALNPFAVILSVLVPDISTGISELTQMNQPIWVVYTIIYALLGMVSLLVAVKRLRNSE